MENTKEKLEQLSQLLLEKAAACQKPSDSRAFFDLSLAAIDRAIELERELRANSLLYWLEIGLHTRGPLTYQAYADFCARNNLVLFSPQDFDAFVAETNRKALS